MNWLTAGACGYYLLSAMTLPFANKVWLGEWPVLSLVQLPKAFLKSVVHDGLLGAVHQFGWSAGSRSPDYIMTHPWAMTFMCVVPALLLIAALLSFKRGRERGFLVIAVVACAALDTVVTLLFDAWSRLSLFNGSFL